MLESKKCVKFNNIDISLICDVCPINGVKSLLLWLSLPSLLLVSMPSIIPPYWPYFFRLAVGVNDNDIIDFLNSRNVVLKNKINIW